MRLPLRTVKRGADFNMTPMIDVVFLLIIFFLVSSHLASQESQMELDLPMATSGQTPPDVDRIRVTINVLAEGQVVLAGAPVDSDELTRRLRFERERSGDDLEVRIRSDRRVPYQFVEPVMLACARSGIWNVTFAVIRREQ